jgi:SAM-dependent methyltransferase
MRDLRDPEIDVGDLFQRMKADVARRLSQRIVAAEDPGVEPAPVAIQYQSDKPQEWIDRRLPQDQAVPEGIQLKLRPPIGIIYKPLFKALADGRYHIRDLFAFHDRDFVYAAYWAVLGRAPDEAGFAAYLGHIRSGMSKVEILAFLRDSEEGQRSANQLAGLPLRQTLLKISRWPLIGRLVRFASELWNLSESQRLQRNLVGQTITRMEEGQINARDVQLAIQGGLVDFQSGYRKLVDYAATRADRNALGQLESRVIKFNSALTSIHASMANKIDRELLEDSIGSLRSSVYDLQISKAEVNDTSRQERLLNEVSAALQILNKTKIDEYTVNHMQRQFQESINQLTESMLKLQLTKADAESLSQLKADWSHLAGTQRHLMAEIDTRPQRYELKDLTNHLLAIVQVRLTKEDLQPLERNFEALQRQANEYRTMLEDQLQHLHAAVNLLDQSKIERDGLDALGREFRTALDTATDAVQRNIEKLAVLKADRQVLEDAKAALLASIENTHLDVERLHSAVHGLSGSIESLAQSKLDRKSGEIIASELKANFEATLDTVSEKITTTTQLKAEAKIQSGLHDIRNFVEALAETKLDREATGLRAEFKVHSEAAFNELNQSLTALSGAKTDRAIFEASQNEIKAALDIIRKSADVALQNAIGPLNAQALDVKRNLLDQERRLGILLEEARKRLPKTFSSKQIEALLVHDDHHLDAMYASFEDRFRGTRSDIKERAAIYLPYIRECNAGLAKRPVVDLGCGRGEWLELLRDEGLLGRGVDLNRIFLASCREMEFDVTESDAVAFLRDLKPQSVGAITSFHLIEHIPLRALIALLDESLRVLRPGGVVILETPNPENLQVGGCNFYTDPTHRNPLPPNLTQALVELRGFVRPTIVRRDQDRLRKLAPPHVPLDQVLAANINPIVEVMLSNFFVSPDYAVIATKA